MSLIELKPGGEVQSQVLNDNFDYLEDLMSSSIQQLEAKVIGASNNISNITSNMAVIQTNLSNTTTTANGKASKDLSDVEPGVKFKETILDYIAPNYTAGYSISSGFTAPSAGWVRARHYSDIDNQSAELKIDGVVVFRDGNTGSYAAGDDGECFIFLRKGKTVTFTGSGTNTLTFYPCVGGGVE